MSNIIHFQCRACEGEIMRPAGEPGRFPCPHCGKDIKLEISESLRSGKLVDPCAACGHEFFFIQKDFNRKLGLLIVIIGIVLSVYLFSQAQPFYAMMALGASALIDFTAYYFVREVTVCYVCHAIYRGFERNPGHERFDLKELEKHGGREPRVHP